MGPFAGVIRCLRNKSLTVPGSVDRPDSQSRGMCLPEAYFVGQEQNYCGINPRLRIHRAGQEE